LKLTLTFLLNLTGSCLAADPGRSTMTPLPSTEIHAGAELPGFWPFALGDQRYVGVLDRDPGARRSALTVIALPATGPARVVRRIDADDASIHAADARVVGADLVVVLEINRSHALQLVRTPVAALVDAALPAPGFQVLGPLDLTAAQQARVRLQAPEQWNVADVLAPASWLFSPRLVLGTDAIEVLANSADGQALRLAAPPGGVGSAANPVRMPGLPAVPGAAPRTPDAPAATAGASVDNAALAEAGLPQSLVVGGRRYTAYLRLAPPYRPFWTLARYSGLPQAAAGQLAISVDGEPAPRNLSAEHQLGPVIGFSLSVGADGQPLLLALRRTPDGVRLSVLQIGAAGWVRRPDLALDGNAERVTASVGADRGLSVIYAVRVAAGWSLRRVAKP
jgi:hypothetical protein